MKGEPILRAALGLALERSLRFYRHPFLLTGPTPQIKKKEMQDFLDQHGYRVAPVTFDDDDYEFAALYTKPEFKDRVRKEYVPYMESVVAAFERGSVSLAGREFPQIFLIHASQMNADLMPDLLAMFRRRGYTFVSLDHALADPVYRLQVTTPGVTAFPGFIAGRKPRGSRRHQNPIRPPGFETRTPLPRNEAKRPIGFGSLHAIDW